MEAVCPGGGPGQGACEAHALSAALHSIHLYCATISAALMCCCAPLHKRHRCTKHWRGQNVRGVASLIICAVWCCGAAAALLRPSDTVGLVAGLMTPLAWLAAAVFHVALWTRRSTAPILYLAIYWLLTAASSAAILYEHLTDPDVSSTNIQLYIEGLSTLLALLISVVDCLCFYDEVIKRYENNRKSPMELRNISYKHNDTHFYSKVTFFWLNPLLYKGYEAPLEDNDFGEIPENEKSKKDYDEFLKIFSQQQDLKTHSNNPSIWKCYIWKIWPNFYIAGLLKLCGDLIGVVPPLGLAVIIQYINSPTLSYKSGTHVTIHEFFNNGYIMLFIVTLALISQAFLSQNSTHLVTIEGVRLKAALQAMVYNKCMRLAPWSSSESNQDEDSPLLQNSEDSTSSGSGLLTNLVSQDTYNIMSCVWICHYLWAIPLKVAVILYLLYRKLGVSALVGTGVGVFLITPLQFFIGKKLSDNSKETSKRTDHRISKMAEILQGITVIKLYVWEDLFKEKILQLREVELQLLNKDSIYWSFLTFTTQASTILITVITFTTYYLIEANGALTAVNVFAGLAFFNQLTVPLLILPVTVLMFIQAVVSTRRIRDFLELPEANNVTAEDNNDDRRKPDKFNDAFIENSPEDETSFWDKNDDNNVINDGENDDQFSDEEYSKPKSEYAVRFRNAAFTWGMKNDTVLEVDDLDIPTGKLIMVVGSTGSGKSSFLSAILGEMYMERGDVSFNGPCSTWYAGQPPWLLEGSVRENIVMDNPWHQRRYLRVLRATGLTPDLRILPEGDATRLGSHGAPLSGGQRIRVCVARALYSSAKLLALDEPLGALDAALARHIMARALVPAARAGRTVILATNRLELMHYADLILVMEEGRVSGFGRASGEGGGELSRWARLAGEARAAAARAGAGPPGGTARERERLLRELTRQKLQRCSSDDTILGINEATGSHLLAEVPTCAGGSWRRATLHPRPSLSRQFSSPPASMNNAKWRREVRRVVSADESNAALQREASLLRRLLRPHRTLTRWTPRALRRLISSESDTPAEEIPANNSATDDIAVDSVFESLTSINGGENNTEIIANESANTEQETPESINEWKIWWEYARACGWWGVAYCFAACATQTLAVAADCWLTRLTAEEHLDDQQLWVGVRTYALVCAAGLVAACVCQCACAAGGARGRRSLHERLLHATLHAPLPHYRRTPPGHTLHRFSHDILVVDKKLPTAISRWAHLALLCAAAMLVNVVLSPWSTLALLPAVLCYFFLQAVYLCNARELQRAEARSAGGVVSLCAETCAGGATVRAGRLQPRMRAAFLRRLDVNHNALLLLNAANRWLGLSLDLVGAASASVALGVALAGESAAAAGLAGTYSLLLPAYLAHLAKCRADLDQQLAALERVHVDTNVPQEDYRDDCPIPPGWQRNGKIEFENVSIQYEPGSPPILHNINLTVAPGEKLAVCGRSGSGKSTLLLSCVGATSIISGRILLDGEDVTKVPLRTLRHRVVVLPQEPAMFSGTLRENLDPLAVHTDEEIWQCLKAVGLSDFVSAQPAGLECTVERSRCGWSVGRVSLACGARAALHGGAAAALVLDEPAAALHRHTERALLHALSHRATLITVAHRISSVRGYDRAVVLEAGRAAEQGSIPALLACPTSRLARMLATANTTN